jgi:hypothetical protein
MCPFMHMKPHYHVSENTLDLGSYSCKYNLIIDPMFSISHKLKGKKSTQYTFDVHLHQVNQLITYYPLPFHSKSSNFSMGELLAYVLQLSLVLEQLTSTHRVGCPDIISPDSNKGVLVRIRIRLDPLLPLSPIRGVKL